MTQKACILLASLFLVCASQTLSANYVLLLPVNVTLSEGQRINLSVKTPDNFESPEGILKMPAGGSMQEFFPTADTEIKRWSEVITIQSWVGQRVSAHQKVEQLRSGLQRVTSRNEILLDKHDDQETFQEAQLMVRYHNPMLDREEIIYAEYFSGPYDCSGYQYSISLSESMTAEVAAEKIKRFRESNTELINF